jgi:hypothetical protein
MTNEASIGPSDTRCGRWLTARSASIHSRTLGYVLLRDTGSASTEESTMYGRIVAVALLLAGSGVSAATKHPAKASAKPATTPTENIDVDALARAKDGKPTDAAAKPADSVAPAEGSDSDGATPPEAVAAPTQPIGATPAETPSASTEPRASEAPEAASNAKSATSAAAADGASMDRPTPLAPPAAPSDIEKSIAAGCESRAASLLDAAQKGDYATATRDFDAKMRTALPPPKFKQAWESLAQFGALQGRGQAHPMTGDGYIAITIPLIFDKKNLYAQVACGSDGRVAGFYIKPL